MYQQLSPSELAKLKLWYILHHSISSYFKLLHIFQDAEQALDLKHLEKWQQLKLHTNHIERFKDFHTNSGQAQFEKRFELIKNHCRCIKTIANRHCR